MKEHTIASRIVATCCAAAVACAAAICALTTRDAVAAPTDSASGSIAITYQHKSNDGADSNAGGASDSGTAGTGEFAIPGATFRLYKVGQVSSGANFEPVAPFTDSTAYPIDWSKVTGYDAQVYRDVANTLAGLIAANGTSESAAVDSGETDKAGRLTFAGVEDGLYLVVSDSVKVEGAAGAAAVGGTADEDSYWQCASANMLVAMPQDGVSNGSRELAIEPKTECSTQLKPTLERTVRKVWNDRNDSDGKRPEAITVKLLRDGVVFEEVKLNESTSGHIRGRDFPPHTSGRWSKLPYPAGTPPSLTWKATPPPSPTRTHHPKPRPHTPARQCRAWPGWQPPSAPQHWYS